MCSFHGTPLAKHVVLLTIILSLNFIQASRTSEAGRFLAEEGSDNHNNQKSAKELDDTVRPDPLDLLKKYHGGYNISNAHYWSSVTFTGIYGVAAAVVWLLCGLGYGVYALVRATCCKGRREVDNTSQGFPRILILAVVFTLLAIASCGMVFGGNQKFYSRARKVVDVLTDTANEASNSIDLINGAFKQVNRSLIEIGSSSKATNIIASASRELDAHAAVIKKEGPYITQKINKGLHIVFKVITTTVVVILVLVIALLAFGVLKFRRTVYFLVAVCWILAVLPWLFFGVYFLFDNLTGDTCTVLKGFEQYPYNSSLSAVLPCDKLRSVYPTLMKAAKGVHDSVDKVNQNITASYGDILQICNPFSAAPNYDYRPWDCPASSTKIGDIPRVLRMVACPDDKVKICKGGIMIRGSYYRMVEAYSSSIQKLLDVFPLMENLVTCQIIKDAFANIVDKHCKPLRRYLHVIWGSFLSLASVLVALLIIWIIQAHHPENHQSSG